MAVAFGQGLFSGSSKTTGTSLTLSGSATVTAGNTILVAYSFLTNGTGTASCTDNLGNTYTELISQPQLTGAGIISSLLTADITTGGALTSITPSGSSASARAGLAVEFSGVDSSTAITGSFFPGAGGNTFNCYPGGSATATATQTSGHLWVGTYGWKNVPSHVLTIPAPSSSGVAATVPVAQVGTIGGSAGSNVAVAFAYFICDAAAANCLNGQLDISTTISGVGADIAPTVSTLLWKPHLGPNYRR